MRVLLDENLPVALARKLIGHSVDSVRRRGWAGLKDGDLLERAKGRYDVLLTMDRRFGRWRTTPACGVVLIRARSNRIEHLLPLIPEIARAIESVRPGQLEVVQDSR